MDWGWRNKCNGQKWDKDIPKYETMVSSIYHYQAYTNDLDKDLTSYWEQKQNKNKCKSLELYTKIPKYMTRDSSTYKYQAYYNDVDNELRIYLEEK